MWNCAVSLNIYVFGMELALLSPEEFSRRATELVAQACPSSEHKSFFDRNMAAASALSMNWVESLLIVIQKRRGLN